MTTHKIDQKEYLKKYLSTNLNDDSKKKKKKKSVNVNPKNLRVIDDDIDVNQLLKGNEDPDDFYATNEEAPQVVGVIDDRAPEVIAKEDFKQSSKWKSLAEQSKQNKKYEDKKHYRDNYNASKIDTKKSGRDMTPPVDLSPIRKSRRDLLEPTKCSRSSPLDLSPKRGTDCIHNAPVLSPILRRRQDDLSPPRRSVDRGYNSDRFKSSRSYFRRSPSRKSDRYERSPDLSPRRRGFTRRSPFRSRSKHYSPRKGDLSPTRKRKRSSSSIRNFRRSRSLDRKMRHSSRGRRRSSDSSTRRLRKSRSPSVGRLYDRRRTSKSPSIRICDENRRRQRSHSKERMRSRSYESKKWNKRDTIDLCLEDKKLDDNSLSRRSSRSKGRRSKSPSLGSSRYSKRSRRANSPPLRSQETQTSEKMVKTLDGKTAGLQSAKALIEEGALMKQKEDEMYKKMSDEMSGRSAEVSIRERKSTKIKELEENSAKDSELEERELIRKEQYDRWGKGVKQVEDYRAKMNSETTEMDKPLARYANDDALERLLREQERDGDPMLKYLQAKKEANDRREGLLVFPAYKGPFQENRFGIHPGYRWDGVDRSNGYERKWFEHQGKKKAMVEEAYRYSTEDM